MFTIKSLNSDEEHGLSKLEKQEEDTWQSQDCERDNVTLKWSKRKILCMIAFSLIIILVILAASLGPTLLKHWGEWKA